VSGPGTPTRAPQRRVPSRCRGCAIPRTVPVSRLRHTAYRPGVAAAPYRRVPSRSAALPTPAYRLGVAALHATPRGRPRVIIAAPAVTRVTDLGLSCRLAGARCWVARGGSAVFGLLRPGSQASVALGLGSAAYRGSRCDPSHCSAEVVLRITQCWGWLVSDSRRLEDRTGMPGRQPVRGHSCWKSSGGVRSREDQPRRGSPP
jgi:hypothetical protein